MRVIQVGVGGFGRSWATHLRDDSAVELVAVVDPFPAARSWAVSELGLADEDCLADLDQALARDDWDAALVITPPETHRAVAERILEAGRDVLSEKPLATTLDDAQALVATATRTERILMVSQNYRHRPPLRAVQRLVAAGEIGEVRSIRIDFRRDTRTLFGEGNFRYTMRHPLIVDMAIHQFDMLRALTGQNASRVYARSWHVPDGHYDHHAAATVVLTLVNGAVVTYSGDWATRDAETSWNGDWEIRGEAGRIRWTGDIEDRAAGSVELQRWGKPWESIHVPALDAVDRAGTLRAFREAVVNRVEPETSAADNIQSLAIVLAAVESVETGEAIPVHVKRS